MAKKTTTEKKASARKATPRAAKPKREKAPRQELCVFAIRLTSAERDAIHAAAGPRNATRFVRQVAVAFSNGDEASFRAALKDARELRG